MKKIGAVIKPLRLGDVGEYLALLSAAFFLTAGYIGTDKLLPRDKKYGNVEKDRLLNWTEVSEMRKSGFTFGSHSLTHADLAAEEPEKARKEIGESKKILEARLQEPVNFFCYPFGSYSPEVKKMVAVFLVLLL